MLARFTFGLTTVYICNSLLNMHTSTSSSFISVKYARFTPSFAKKIRFRCSTNILMVRKLLCGILFSVYSFTFESYDVMFFFREVILLFFEHYRIAWRLKLRNDSLVYGTQLLHTWLYHGMAVDESRNAKALPSILHTFLTTTLFLF